MRQEKKERSSLRERKEKDSVLVPSRGRNSGGGIYHLVSSRLPPLSFLGWFPIPSRFSFSSFSLDFWGGSECSISI